MHLRVMSPKGQGSWSSYTPASANHQWKAAWCGVVCLKFPGTLGLPSMGRAGSGNQRKSRIKEPQVLAVANLVASTSKDYGNMGLAPTAFAILDIYVCCFILLVTLWNSSFPWILEHTTLLVFCHLFFPLLPILLVFFFLKLRYLKMVVLAIQVPKPEI